MATKCWTGFMARRPLGQGLWLAWWFALLALGAARGFAQQQFQGLCARVKIEILQELTIERIGFEATLEVTNNDGEDPITDFFADLTFARPALGGQAALADAADLFFVRAPQLSNVNDIAGRGVVGSTRKGTVKWFIIPKIAAGGNSPNGVVYSVGCNLAGKMRGVPIPDTVLFAVADTITVRPEPQLEITYFQPRDVQGDDPFTPAVESPIPFTLGVLVKNAGYGSARRVKIDSQQPKIVENRQNLLLVAQLIGARVMDAPRSPSLMVDLGDIPPGQARKGAWDMITSLSGEFVEFKASYTHASELGGEETSVIKSLAAHFIAHEVLNDQPGRDTLKDFLADTDRDPNLLPDALFESEGFVLPVNPLTNATVEGSAGPGGSFQVQLVADVAGWGYLRLNDPGQARLKIASVVRSDGKTLNPNNYWTNIRYTRAGNVRQNFLNLFDLVDLHTYTYTVTYAAGAGDVTPPVTSLRFVGSVTEAADRFFITPDTQVYFLSEDENPVSIFYRVASEPFRPALPFNLRTPGDYLVTYYAQDAAGNRESDKSARLVVAGAAALGFARVELPASAFFLRGDTLSVRPAQARLQFQALPNPTRVDAHLAVFRGVQGFVTVAGVPSSPTADTSASLAVGGDFVDWYRYRLNQGTWSAEQPVASPLVLSGLAPGVHTLAVLGRSRQGDYPDASHAVTVSWTVGPTAPSTRITGTPATPSRETSAVLAIGGANVTDYRWTLDGGYYRAESSVTNPLALTDLTGGAHIVAALGKVGGGWQETNNPTTVTWTVNPLYGADLSALTQVRTLTLTNIGATTQSFVWDGRSDSGAGLPPGWYTVRLLLTDRLGHTNFATRLVQLGELSGPAAVLAEVERGPRNPQARGHWAVWQDQSDGHWQVYAQDLSSSNPPLRQLTRGTLSQECPRTDGRYVVWQGRQINGNWDVLIQDLNGQDPPAALTSTADLDETRPVVDWPWVVWQVRSLLDPTAPWQLRAHNLLTRQTSLVSASTQDQLDPDVYAGLLVWQDFRDVGYGEIYSKNLETDELRRLTTNPFGQYHPAVFHPWVVWQDNRHGQVELYGFDLLRDTEVRLSNTPENEAWPRLDGPWVICEEDSLGPQAINLRLLHLPSLRAVPLTRTLTFKARPALAGNRAVWQDTQDNLARILTAELPVLQPVFQNANAVAITDSMVSFAPDAYTLLNLWHAQAGVQEITRYVSLVPNLVSETARWANDAPSGANFNLTAGSFLWIKFDQTQVLDLGANTAAPLNLSAGLNVFSYAHFPSELTAYRLLRQLGLGNVRAVRMLDAESGRWAVAGVEKDRLVGQDFAIPKVAVLLLEMARTVNRFQPQ
ncbi:MAG: hypothetical protein FJ387_15385 [Verrucomicrobia bacterium]|nr:hypothetical protein [Verrucomicrobiota bacterium]